MVNKYEDIILKLNKFNWIVALAVGVIELIVGISWGIFGGALITYGVLGIVAGIIGKMKVVGPINDKKFDETWVLVLVCGILGVIGYPGGALFIVQAILIKIGGK